MLEDGVVTERERAALGDLAALYGLDAAGVAAAHRGFLLALAHLALDDGRVSGAEEDELTAVAVLLDVPVGELTAVREAADAARLARLARLSAGLGPLPADWLLGEPLRVGDKAENARRYGTRTVSPADFALPLDHLQPTAHHADPEPPTIQVVVPPAAIRAWAKANGIGVSARGRLLAEVTDAYRRANEVSADRSG